MYELTEELVKLNREPKYAIRLKDLTAFRSRLQDERNLRVGAAWKPFTEAVEFLMRVAQIDDDIEESVEASEAITKGNKDLTSGQRLKLQELARERELLREEQKSRRLEAIDKLKQAGRYVDANYVGIERFF